MATQHGYRIGKELVDKHGWKWSSSPEPEVYGDRWVIDPVTRRFVTQIRRLPVALGQYQVQRLLDLIDFYRARRWNPGIALEFLVLDMTDRLGDAK